MGEPTIRYGVDDRVATVTIDRPEKKGAMTFAILEEFNRAIRTAAEDADAQVVILTGTPGSFCAGTDLADLNETPESERIGRGADASQARVPWPLIACPKPVIAAIDGPAVGMGAEFATQCDVRILSSRARVAWNFVRRGLVADTGAGTYLLPRLIGVTEALRLLYSGDFLSADDALRLGFAIAVVEPDDLQAAARAEADRYLGSSPFSIARTKQLVYEGLDSAVADHHARTGRFLQECFHSADHAEGVAAFLERREPRFTGT
jgi:enoyl-CoA hydratase/carnithine racemase